MTDKLLRAYGEIDDRFIEECLAETDSCIDGVLERDCGKIVRVNTGRKTKPAAWHRVAAAVILVALALSTAYQVNAQFRQWVISIVRLNGREEIREQHMPAASGTTNSSEAVINVSPVKKIDDILEVQYVTAKKPVEPYEDIYVSKDRGKETYFSVQNNACVSIRNIHSFKGTICWQGQKGFANANVISYQGKQYVRNIYDLYRGDQGGRKIRQKRFLLSADDTGGFWLTLSKESDEGTYEYPLRCDGDIQDINTAKLTDIFRNIRINGKRLCNYPVITNWETISDRYYCALVGKTQKTAKYYMVDTVQKKAVSLEELTKQKDIRFVRALGNTMIIGTASEGTEEECYDCYRFDLQSGEKKELFHHVVIGEEDDETNEVDRVAFTGGRYDLFTKNGTTYLVDELTGERIKLEGMDADLNTESVMINASGDKLLLSARFSENGIRKFGILDVPERKLYLLERKNLTQSEESSVHWLTEDTFAIESDRKNGQESMICQYRIR